MMQAEIERAFERGRPRLTRIARRILGDAAEAEDVVQESWIKAARATGEEVRDTDAWATTIVTRCSIDRLRQRKRAADTPVLTSEASDPAQHAFAADAIGVALLIVLDRLAPLERVAFVLHDVFGTPFDEIAAMIDRSPAAARQLASRARRRVRGGSDAVGAGVARHRELAEAFVTAARSGDMRALLQLLHPEVVLSADAAALRMGPGAPLVGAEPVARFFAGRAAGAHVATVAGEVGLIVVADDRLRLAVMLRFDDARITTLHAMADPDTLARTAVTLA